MSEYQYYEFLAVDRPLTERDMEKLRKVSTRAKITPVSFRNEYNWGDLKANPRDLRRDYFDVHVYFANWGNATLMVRLPRDVIDQKALEAFCVSPHLEYEKLPDHWLLVWSLGETEDPDRFYDDLEGRWMARLAPLREELLQGDLRSLYIGWLRAVTMDMVEPDEREPMALSGLTELTKAQKSLAEFMEVDVDLLAGAGIGSPARKADAVDETAIDAWLEELPRPEVLDYLKQMLLGQGTQAERALKKKYSEWRRISAPEEKGTRRTVAELWNLAEQAEKLRTEKQDRAIRKAEAERKKKREAQLTELSGDFPRAWKTAHDHAVKGTAPAYDAALQLLIDLRDAYSLRATPEAFQEELERFMTEHGRRRALVDRLVKAGLWRAG